MKIGILITALFTTGCSPTPIQYNGPPSLLVVPPSYYSHVRERPKPPIPFTGGLSNPADTRTSVEVQTSTTDKLDEAGEKLSKLRSRLNRYRKPTPGELLNDGPPED